MKILQICAYAASYDGNFIKSLIALEKEMQTHGYETVYAFPEKAKETYWCQAIEKTNKVYYLKIAKARILPHTYLTIRKIFKENKDIQIVHSHFELYDIPVTLMAPSKVRIFWHLHDPIQIRKGLHGILNKIQYDYMGKRATLLSVSEKYRKDIVQLGFPEKQSFTILNGIDLTRIRPAEQPETNKEYKFVTFGWDFYRKGCDTIIQACELLANEGYKFKMLLNGGANTWNELKNYLHGKMPSYLECCDPEPDVNLIFQKSEVFIQASRRETFSYAICEAAYYGLPVISTDIAGVEWAHSIPSVNFVKAEDFYALKNIMKDFLEGKTISSQVISDSQKAIIENYTVAVWVKNVIAHYQIQK